MAFAMQNERRALAEMNITPLVDVMLVLLVIFMISAPPLTHQVSLPLPQKCERCKVPDKTLQPATLQVLAGGQLRWDGQSLEPEALSAQLRVHAKSAAPLIINSMDDAIYADVASVLSQVSKAGIKRIQMMQ